MKISQDHLEKRPVELLAPAGSLEGLHMAIQAGADAVYMGGQKFGARAFADNPDEKQLIGAIDFCHLHGRKLYLTVNTLLKEEEISGALIPFLTPYYEAGLDAVLVQDLGVMTVIHQHFPDLPIHASTQMSIQSPDGAMLLRNMGAMRIVPARELSLREVNEIYQATGMEIECFVHGALCYSYSGQCLMSSLIGGRSGNRGRCAQPCRQPYALQGEQGRAGYLLSLKDIMTLPMLGRMIEAGVCSFKIEGRMKRPEYAAGVTMIYRRYLDRYLATGNADYQVDPEDERMLMDLYNRGGFSGGYYEQEHGRQMMSMNRPNHAGTKAASVVRAGKGSASFRALEPLYAGDALENASATGNSHQELILERDVKKGETISVKTACPLQKGDTLSRVRCEKLLSFIRQQTEGPLQEKIKGIFSLRSGSPAILRVIFSYGTSLTGESGKPERAEQITVTGPVPEAAARRETTPADLEKQLRKTGGTPFVFDTLTMDVAPGLFFPISQVNQMRRSALNQLLERVLAAFRRAPRPGGTDASPEDGESGKAASESVNTSAWRTSGETAGQPVTGSASGEQPKEVSACVAGMDAQIPDGGLCRLEAEVSNLDQAQAAARCGRARVLCLDSLYFMDQLVSETGQKDFSMVGSGMLESFQADMEGAVRALAARQHAHGGALCLSMPPLWRKKVSENFFRLFREPARALFDGFYLNCQDQLGAIGRIRTNDGQKIFAGSRLYVWNRASARTLYSLGCDEVTAGVELNAGELSELDLSHAAIPVYGFLPVMTTAQCLKDNCAGCDRKPGKMLLRDRRGADFPVYNHCGICANVICNSVPLSLISYSRRIRSMRPGAVRLYYTDEDEREVESTLLRAGKAFSETETQKPREAVSRDGGAAQDRAGVSVPEKSRFTYGHFKRGVE